MVEVVMNKGRPDAERKSCYDCFYCQSALSWWCRNEEAVAYRGTSIPGVYKCTFWKPVRVAEELSFWDKLFKDIMYIQNETSLDVSQLDKDKG